MFSQTQEQTRKFLSFCPHLSQHLLNSYLVSKSLVPKTRHIMLSKFYDPFMTYNALNLFETQNHMQKFLIDNFSSDWIALNNPQNLSFSSINREGCVFTFDFDDSGSIMASTNHNHNIEIWDMNKKKIKKILNNHSEIVTGVDFFNGSNSSFLSCSLDKTIKLWKNYTCVHTFIEHSDWIRCINLRHDNLRFLSGCVSSVIKLWDIPKRCVLFSITNANPDPRTLSTINSLGFMKRDPNIFLTGLRSGEVKLFDIRVNNSQNKQPQQQFRAHIKKLNNVKFNRNDTYLLSSGRDSLLRLWDIRKLPNNINDTLLDLGNKSVYEYSKHKCCGYNIECNFWQNDKYIMTGSEDNGFYIYETQNPNKFRKISCQQKCINLIKPIPQNMSIAFTGLEDISIFIWNSSKSISKSYEQNYNKKYKKEEYDNNEEDEKDMSKYDEVDRNQQICSKLIEEIMSEFGDNILKIFHSNNLTYSNGLNFETLLEIIQKNKDDESMKIFQMINDRFMKKLMENFVGGMNSKKNADKESEVKKKKVVTLKTEVKCADCKGEKTKKIENIICNNIDDLIKMPNLYDFNKANESDKKIVKEEETIKEDDADTNSNEAIKNMIDINEENVTNAKIELFNKMV